MIALTKIRQEHGIKVSELAKAAEITIASVYAWERPGLYSKPRVQHAKMVRDYLLERAAIEPWVKPNEIFREVNDG